MKEKNPFIENPHLVSSPTSQLKKLITSKEENESFKVPLFGYDMKVIRSLISQVCKKHGIEYKTAVNENGSLYMIVTKKQA